MRANPLRQVDSEASLSLQNPSFCQKVWKVVLAVWEAVKGFFCCCFQFRQEQAVPSLENRVQQNPSPPAQPVEQSPPVPEPVVVPVPPVLSVEELNEIIDLAHSMEELYDTVLRDLHKLDGKEGKQLVEMIDQFHLKHQSKSLLVKKSYPDESLPVKAFNAMEAIDRSIFYLRSLNCNLFLTYEIGINKADEMVVPGDGNCLFHAILAKLQLIEPRPFIAGFTPLELRLQANVWLKEKYQQNDEQVVRFLTEALESYHAAKRRSLEEDKSSHTFIVQNWRQLGSSEEDARASALKLQAIEQGEKELAELDISRYLQLAAREGFFGCIAEVYALSHICNRTIKVNYKVRGEIWEQKTFSPSDASVGDRPITLAYKVDQRHFNAQAYED
ncbi:MAG: hypothetical protein KGJ02_07300 [Verrucomicrobiota bacterium]|nr:hypothetical protein [Verrucomicrobiota bacterium]